MIKAGIYLHFPFCTTKCFYCDFYSLAQQEHLIPNFITAVINEIETWKGMAETWQFDSIFIGGGTPSLLTLTQLQPILTAIQSKYNLSSTCEITLEANPESITFSKLKDYRRLGINRISLGIQSFNAKNIKFLTRIHTTEDVATALADAREAGFENINCDLIYGLPEQTWAQWSVDLDRIIEFKPQHLSCYSLTAESNTGLHDQIQAGAIHLPQDDTSSELFLRTRDYLSRHGYQRYEISNFAQRGFECRHNQHYWRIEPYIGFGPSAHSFDGRRRWWNSSDLNQYLERVESDKPVIESEEVLTDRELVNERIGFGLRMAEGFLLTDIPEQFRLSVLNQVNHCLKKWPGRLVREDTQVRLTESGMVLADSITVDLLMF